MSLLKKVLDHLVGSFLLLISDNVTLKLLSIQIYHAAIVSSIATLVVKRFFRRTLIRAAQEAVPGR